MRLLIASIFLLLVGCSSKFQVWETTATNSELVDNSWTFENNFVRVTYYFWKDRGIMSYAIYNKSDKPVYVNWKSSSFVYNDDKFNYWIDEELSASTSYDHGFFYRGPLIKPGYSVNAGVQNTISKSIKPEKVTFIPPKSNYYKSDFYLKPTGDYKFKQKKSDKKSIDGSAPNSRNGFNEVNFSAKNSPLAFRNFLAFSLAEFSDDYFFVDNEFYVHSIKKMSKKVFKGKVTSKAFSEYVTHSYPFAAPTSFFIETDPDDGRTYNDYMYQK